jgi:predicted MFS family arabinose efflux permease
MCLGYYMIHSTLQTKATELAPGARGTAVSLFAFSLFLGQGIGAALLGVIINRPNGYIVSFCLSGVVMALLGIWLVWHSRHHSVSVSATDEAGVTKSHPVIVSD